VGDPTHLVYDRLFAAQPEMRALFALDRNDAVKGNMLAQLIDAMIDLAGEGHYARGLIRAEVINHENLGVPPEVFTTFVDTVIATFREALGADWTDTYDRAWADVAREFKEMLSPAAV
jgi:hemoglobin-like flavoprotein